MLHQVILLVLALSSIKIHSAPQTSYVSMFGERILRVENYFPYNASLMTETLSPSCCRCERKCFEVDIPTCQIYAIIPMIDGVRCFKTPYHLWDTLLTPHLGATTFFRVARKIQRTKYFPATNGLFYLRNKNGTYQGCRKICGSPKPRKLAIAYTVSQLEMIGVIQMDTDENPTVPPLRIDLASNGTHMIWADSMILPGIPDASQYPGLNIAAKQSYVIEGIPSPAADGNKVKFTGVADDENEHRCLCFGNALMLDLENV